MLPRPSQFRSAFVTIAIRPSGERNGTNEATDLGYSGSEIFFEAGLDDPNHVESTQEISFFAQERVSHFGDHAGAFTVRFRKTG